MGTVSEKVGINTATRTSRDIDLLNPKWPKTCNNDGFEGSLL